MTGTTPADAPAPGAVTAFRVGHDRPTLPGSAVESRLADRLSAARELRDARDLAASIIADAEHRAGVLMGTAQLLMEEARAERAHAERYTGMAADRARAVIAGAQAEHDRLLATARLKATLIVASARSQAGRITRDQHHELDEHILIRLSEEPADRPSTDL
jgi:F0F1-type ATP synthase membrane subunit b/b'